GIFGALVGAYGGLAALRELNTRVHVEHARVFLRAGDAQAAIEEATEALALARGSASAHLVLGEALESLGERTGALREYREALEEGSNSPIARTRLEAMT